jgi:hypothetical protein
VGDAGLDKILTVTDYEAGASSPCMGAINRSCRTCPFSRQLIQHDYGARGREHAADAVADRDLGIGDLGGGGAADLAHVLLQTVHAVDAGMHVREAAAIGVERQLAAGGGVALGDEGAGLAARHKAEIFEAIDRQMHHPLRLSRWNGQRSNSPDGPKSRVHFISRRLPMPQV